MHPEFFEGFTIYRKGEGPVFVTPHSGPSLETPTNRDDNSDTIASLCWLKSGGSLVLSNVSRKRLLGIDFNRAVPPMRKALKMYKDFLFDRSPEQLLEYRNKYAFVAKDERDYHERVRIHDNFWFQIKNLGNVFIFVHRKFSKLKNYPSIMDVVSFKGKGINVGLVKNVIDELNSEYDDFLKKIGDDYKRAIMNEEKRSVERSGLADIKALQKPRTDKERHIAKSVKLIRKYAKKSLVDKLENNFDPNNYINAVESALGNAGTPQITLDSIFTSELASAPRKRFYLKEMRKDIISMEIECNQFINYWYPEVAAEMINKMVDKVRNAEIYKILGPMQTVIIKFLGGKDEGKKLQKK